MNAVPRGPVTVPRTPSTPLVSSSHRSTNMASALSPTCWGAAGSPPGHRQGRPHKLISAGEPPPQSRVKTPPDGSPGACSLALAYSIALLGGSHGQAPALQYTPAKSSGVSLKLTMPPQGSGQGPVALVSPPQGHTGAQPHPSCVSPEPRIRQRSHFSSFTPAGQAPHCLGLPTSPSAGRSGRPWDLCS